MLTAIHKVQFNFQPQAGFWFSFCSCSDEQLHGCEADLAPDVQDLALERQTREGKQECPVLKPHGGIMQSGEAWQNAYRAADEKLSPLL